MGTFAIDLLTGKEYLFNGNFISGGTIVTSGFTSVSNGLTKSGTQVRLGGTLTQNTVFNGGAPLYNLRYAGDYSANYTDRSLVDRGYVNLRISANTPTWLTLLSRPTWLTGTTLSAFQLGHSHSQYLTGVTWNQVSGKPNLTLQSSFNTHTGDTLIHFRQSAITITESQVTNLVHDLATKSNTAHTHTWAQITTKPQWLSGTTKNAFQTGHTHSYNNLSDKPTLFTGNTFIGSGGTQVITAGDKITIYSVVPSGSSTTWNDITGKPQWLSATTKSAFETGHTHSYNNLSDKLSGGTGISIINNIINVTGVTPITTTSALQLLDISGGTDVNTIAATPIIWTQLTYSGTGLNFTGGSRIYVQTTGIYEISYSMNTKNNTGSPKNIGTVMRKNNVADVTPLSSSAFNQNNVNNISTNVMPEYLVSLSAGDYLELIGFRIGTSGQSITKANGSWMKIKKL